MTTLVQAALHVRRGARASYGYLTAAALGLLALLGLFRVQADLGPEHMVVGLAWLIVLGMRTGTHLRSERRKPTHTWFDLELGLLMLTGGHALLQLFGGLQGALYPALYVFVAFVSSFAEQRTGRLLVVAAIGFEGLLYFVTEGHREPAPFLLHALFLTLFGLLNGIFTQAEIRRVRRQSKRALQDERDRMQADARLFRLVTPGAAAERDDERLFRSSVEEVHQALLFNLELMQRTMGLHTCALLMGDDTGEWLRVAELVTDSDDIAEGPFPAGTGAVGAATKRRLIMNLEHLRPGYPGICYYAGPARVQAFVSVPLLDVDGEHVRGVLCADRLEDRPFSLHEEETLKQAAQHLLRALENERLFVQLERAKREHTVLRQASEALGAAMSERDVLEAALGAASEIAPFEFAAVTHYDATTGCHTIRRAVGEGAARFANLTFRDNTSLTAMVVKNRHYLPYRGEFDPGSQVVFTPRANLAGMDSLLILPLLVREEAIGTFCLSAHRPEAFHSQVRPALSVLANQLAVALSNAASVARLEELATTDGLTGCYNKRYFHEEMQSRLQAAQRFGRKLSLIITDIDHFKVVNDTYGHGTGDLVLQQLGELLRKLKRETDVVARFGGEEFCILCEETDARGAAHLAGRIREELEGSLFDTELGKLKVTCSLGVATFPDHGVEKQALFDAADRALYAAKRGGRNRVEVAQPLPGAKKS